MNTQLQAPGGATNGTAYRSVPQVGDMEVHATIASGPANGNGAAIFVNLKNVGTTGFQGYGVRMYKQIGGYVWNLYRYDNGYNTGSPTSLDNWSRTPAQGDRILLRRVGGQLQAWYYTVSNQTWTLEGDADDSTYLNGHIGVQIIDNGYGGVPVLDDFGGTDAVTEPPAQGALPATPVLDHFNRAPEDPLSQAGNWGPTDLAGSASGTLEVSGVLARNLDVSFWARSYRTTDYSGYTEAYFTVGAMPGSGQALELFLDLNDVGAAAWDGYRFIVLDSSTDQFILERVTNGNDVQALGSPESRNIAAGDRLLARRIGLQLEFWHDVGGLGNWTKVRSETDPTYMTGKIGIGMRGKNGAIENFGGGGASDASLLRLYVPELRYTGDETYRADSAALGTDLFFHDDPLNLDRHTNFLDRLDEFGEAYHVAAADPDTVLYFDDLSLGYLGTQAWTNDRLNQPNFSGDEILSAEVDYKSWVLSNPDYRRFTYGHVIQHPSTGEKLLQYWFYYYYNPKNVANISRHHEGDWEWVNVRLDSANTPVSVSASQHGAGERCEWGPSVELQAKGRPVVYVAHESHANYFWAGSHPVQLGFSDFTSNEEEEEFREVPQLIDVTTPPAWLLWSGYWGSSFGAGQSPKTPSAQRPWWDPWGWEDETGTCTLSPYPRSVRAKMTAHSQPALKRSTAQRRPALPRILSARVVTGTKFGRAVRVSYCFASMPRDPWRRPARLHLTLDNMRDNSGPLSHAWKVTKRCAIVTHPTAGLRRPYVLRYTAESVRGTRSKQAHLAVR